MKLKAFVLIFLFMFSYGFTDSILLINDSGYDLTAEIRAANGDVLGSFQIGSGERQNFMVTLSRSQLKTPNVPSNSITPYSVVWKCSYKGIYSVNTGVSPGAMVRANSGDGGKYCESKPEEEQNLKYRCPPCPPCPVCPLPPAQNNKTESSETS